MKNIINILGISLISILLFTASNQSFAKVFEEGKHYTVVAPRITDKAELREYFSYYCPTCRAYEPYLADFSKVLPADAKFNKVHVDFMPHTSPEIQLMLSKALIVAEKTGVDKAFSAAVFKYLQTDKAKIDTEKDLRNIYVLNGGVGNKFDQGMRNFSVIKQAKSNKKQQDKLSKARHLKSVPTMVVNGKYLINATSLDSKNFFGEYTELVAYLFTLK